jgi:hypothetical protein
MILEALMRTIDEIERRHNRDAGYQQDEALTSYLPGENASLLCHYFDYIVGSSSGAYDLPSTNIGCPLANRIFQRTSDDAWSHAYVCPPNVD